jgi:hypothetical protein
VTVAAESILFKACSSLAEKESPNNVTLTSRFQTGIERVGIADAITILSTGTSSFD